MGDVEERVAELEERVELLESLITNSTNVAGRDRYDSAVLENLREEPRPVPVRRLHKWYRRAGVRSESKIKGRLRDLAEDGLIQQVGTNWEYAGPRQGKLGEPA